MIDLNTNYIKHSSYYSLLFYDPQNCLIVYLKVIACFGHFCVMLGVQPIFAELAIPTPKISK